MLDEVVLVPTNAIYRVLIVVLSNVVAKLVADVAVLAFPVRGPANPVAVSTPVFALNVNDVALFNVDTVPLVVGENRTR